MHRNRVAPAPHNQDVPACWNDDPMQPKVNKEMNLIKKLKQALKKI